MNPQTHRVIFNKSRGCMMAVSEVASGQGKGKSRKSRIKRCKKLGLTALNVSKPNPSHFYPSNTAIAHISSAQAASKSIATTDIVWLVEQTITVPDDKTGGAAQPKLKPLSPSSTSKSRAAT